MNEPDATRPQDLRRRAEDRLQGAPPPGDSQLSRLLHELQVHQIELELQNEELRNAQAEEVRLKERYSDFYDFSPTGFVSLDRQGGILQVNLMAARLMGRERLALSGERFSAFLDWRDRPLFEAFLGRLFETGTRQACEVNLLVSGREARTVHIEAALAPDGQECRAVVVDVTEQNRASEERRLLELELLQSQKLESLGSLAGGMAHDMNNVLGAVLGMASTLHVAAEPGSSAARSLETIMGACTRGRDVVKSLLYFARKELGEERPVDLNHLAAEIFHLLGATTRKRVTLETELQPGLPLLRGDAGALGNALMNLCVNAIDAMPDGGILRVLTYAQPDGSIVLSVMDTGTGMSGETLSRALDPFFTTKPLGKGTGLGLSVAYGTARAHEGRLELRSQLGAGTEATLTFPASRAISAEALPPDAAGAPGTPVPELLLLIVDDDDLFRASLAGMAAALGHRPVQASSGEEALRMLGQGLPADVVLLDMNMPDMDGAETLKRILALRPDQAVLIDTGYCEEGLAPLPEANPRVRTILKPFSLIELNTMLGKLASAASGRFRE